MQAMKKAPVFLFIPRFARAKSSSTSTAPLVEECTKLKPFSEVPGPKPIPVFGNLLKMLQIGGYTYFLQVSVKIGLDEADLQQLLAPYNFTRWSEDLHKEYGDLVKVTRVPGRKDLVLVFNPRDIEKIFRNEGPWPERTPLGSLQYFRTKVRNDFFEGFQGLANENGENWQKLRSVLNQPMMQPRVTKQYIPKIDEVARDFVRRIPALRNQNQEMPSDFNNELHKWALESIALVALDARLGCLDGDIASDSESQLMIDAVNGIFAGCYELDMKIPLWRIVATPALKRFIAHSDAFLGICLKHVQKAQEQMRTDIPEEDMGVLQRTLRRDPSTKRAVIAGMDLIIGGVDTTSYSAANVLYFLARNPDRQERLYTELCQHMPNKNAPISSTALDDMKYLRMCIKESMRLAPITPCTIRILNKDIELSGYQIPKNLELMMYNSTLCHKNDYFPEASKFIPERWQRGGCPQNTASNASTPPYVFLPFGHGPRQCIGMRFASLEVEVLIARMIRNFRLEWHHGDMTYASRMLITPNRPLKFTVLDRT